MGNKTYNEWSKIVIDKFKEIDSPQWFDMGEVDTDGEIQFIRYKQR